MIIWQFWTGPKPEHIKICEESLDRRAKGATIHRLNPTQARSRFPGMHKRWEKMVVPAQQADYFRAYALANAGGMWIDSDVLVVGSLDDCWRNIREHGLCLCGDPGEPFEGFVGAKKGHPLALGWVEAANRLLGKAIRRPWPAFGKWILRPLAKHYLEVPYIARKRVVVLAGHRRKVLNRIRKALYLIKPDTIGIHLFNKAWGQHMTGSRKKLLEGDALLANLFRHALGSE